MSTSRQIFLFGGKYSFKPWYVNKAFSRINCPYQRTTGSTGQIRNTQLKEHCLNASQLHNTGVIQVQMYSVLKKKHTKHKNSVPHYGMQ